MLRMHPRKERGGRGEWGQSATPWAFSHPRPRRRRSHVGRLFLSCRQHWNPADRAVGSVGVMLKASRSELAACFQSVARCRRSCRPASAVAFTWRVEGRRPCTGFVAPFVTVPHSSALALGQRAGTRARLVAGLLPAPQVLLDLLRSLLALGRPRASCSSSLSPSICRASSPTPGS